ncbi:MULTISPECIES: efflux RND transporter periplasmic adaptor subunit [unclassified Rhizobium]|uniref:efflux RND transporter periplasmic adaptor subunit n=1 Tax=unclassified Rhizobium TaxID=2613769 RepID=UPI0024796D26|nr:MULTISPECIES: efflux RND transporter periplasmic adaptor subunit [unclassified Rhizobium]
MLLFPAVFLSACGDEKASRQAAATEHTEAARVSVLNVQPAKVVVYDELPGRISAYRTAEIRAQVNGIIQKKLFQEGASVDARTPLFQIDPAPFAADAEASAAVLARAEAELLNAQIKFDRAGLLSSQKILSAESFNNATATLAQAKANVAEAKANLARRKLELSYATISSPIAGVIGQSFMSEGGLASSSATAPLAVVQQIDQVYVDVRQSSMSKELLRDMASDGGGEKTEGLPVKIFSIAGKPYEQPGKLLFSDISVDAATGSLGIRILVPNPAQQLLPGMYIRAKVPRAIYSQALMVPQEAVLRDPSGRPQLIVLGADGTGNRRNVETGALVDGQYMVLHGVSAGETIVILGQDRVQPGEKLQTTPYRPSANDIKS